MRVSALSLKTGYFTLTATPECLSAEGSLFFANRMYMSFTMPWLPSHCRIKRAELSLKMKEDAVNMPMLGLYAVTGDIYSGVCTPSASASPLDVLRKPDEKGRYIFDITSFADAVKTGEGVPARLMLRVTNEVAIENKYVTLEGADTAIRIIYENGYTVLGSARSHTHSIGRFGKGAVDLQYGTLMLESEDFTWAGNRMPVSIKHLYTAALAGYTYTRNESIGLHASSFGAMKLGYGFKLNLMQSIVYKSLVHEDGVCSDYVYTGENGEEIYFKKNPEAKICNSDDQCYYLYEDITGAGMSYDPMEHTLRQGEETYLFDAYGRLIEISNAATKSHTCINYVSNQIQSVVDSVGRSFVFNYDGDFLTSITAPDGTQIRYEYEGELLSGITYPDSSRALITYSAGKPASIALRSKGNTQIYKVDYTFQGNRLASITEFGEGGNQGAHSEYSYSAAARRTTVTTYEAADDTEGATPLPRVVARTNSPLS